LLLLVLITAPAPAGAQTDQEEQVRRVEDELEAVRAELERLKAVLEEREEASADAAPGDTSQAQRIAELERRVEILAEELERERIGEGVFRRAERSEHGLGVAASKVYQVKRGLSIGGYGEALYESFDSTRDDGTPAGASDQIDFLRGILYFGYKFTDRWLFNSEIEFEHASTGEEGEASLEFASIEYLHRPALNVRAGLLLVPMGFVNELHEPPLFLSARRPDVDQRIIPTTWRENGFGIFGDAGPFSYRTYVVNGLEGAGFSASGIRGGRQKGSEALAEDFAWTGRLDYTGTPGLLAGVSAYLGDSGQGLGDPSGRTIGARTTIVEAHLELKYRGLELRALGVRGELDDVDRLNAALGLQGAASIGEEMAGFYVQLGYDLFARLDQGARSLIPFARWETYDTQKSVPAGFTSNPANDVELLTVGLAFKPIDQLVFKADYQDYDNDAGTGVDQFNVALGYLF
jgi:hypothetical protein